MIHICRITDISQTTCILRSIPAHFLQLLRDGALRGRTCRRHGLTLNISPRLFSFGSSYLRLSPVERRDGLKPRRRPVLTASSTFASLWRSRSISVFFLCPRLSCSPSLDLRVYPRWRHFNCEMKHFLLLLFFPFGARGCSWRAARSSAARIRQLHWRRKAHPERTDRQERTRSWYFMYVKQNLK